jgi:hypothetical protein
MHGGTDDVTIREDNVPAWIKPITVWHSMFNLPGDELSPQLLAFGAMSALQGLMEATANFRVAATAD